jgi:hypothetical protein
MGPSEKGGVARTFGVAMTALLVLALCGAVVYLLSDINHRRYRLAVEDRALVVERGRMLPLGYKRFEPEAPDLKGAYAPIAVPPGESLGRSEIYDDRADVDRALFSVLASWTRERMTSKEPGDFELATGYVRRCELLPGLSEEQRIELKTLRADLAYRNGRRILHDIVERLKKARDEFLLAKELGASRQTDVDAWIADVERRIRDYVSAYEPAPPQQPEAAPLPMTPERPEPEAPPAPGPAPEPGTPAETPQPKWRL